MKALLCKEFGPPETLSYEEVADPGFNGELLATDYNLFISTDLPDSVEQ